MALIKCQDCSKSISDKASACPSCGCPVGMGVKVADTAFERRIEEYKNAGYKLGKRLPDSVKMYKFGKNRAVFLVLLTVVLLIAWIVAVILSNPDITSYSYEQSRIAERVFRERMTRNIIKYSLIFGIPYVATLISLFISTRVTISLTKTQKIDETGNVLKK